jgi:hypothetical protein
MNLTRSLKNTQVDIAVDRMCPHYDNDWEKARAGTEERSSEAVTKSVRLNKKEVLWL